MAEAFVAIGSNVRPEHHLAVGMDRLRSRFGPLRASQIYRSAPVGFEGADFYNLVIAFEYDAAPRRLCDALRDIERACGRRRSDARFGPRTLDLDLVLHGSHIVDEPDLRLPRRELVEYAFVLGPLAALAGDRRHPVSGQRFDELWEAFDQLAHPLVEVELPGVVAVAERAGALR